MKYFYFKLCKCNISQYINTSQQAHHFLLLLLVIESYWMNLFKRQEIELFVWEIIEIKSECRLEVDSNITLEFCFLNTQTKITNAQINRQLVRFFLFLFSLFFFFQVPPQAVRIFISETLTSQNKSLWFLQDLDKWRLFEYTS